jgi:Tfp pilus assembly protein PilZ
MPKYRVVMPDEVVIGTPKKTNVRDGMVSITIDTPEGTHSIKLRLVDFLGNTLRSQRSKTGLEGSISKAFQTVFGGQVRVE